MKRESYYTVEVAAFSVITLLAAVSVWQSLSALGIEKAPFWGENGPHYGDSSGSSFPRS